MRSAIASAGLMIVSKSSPNPLADSSACARSRKSSRLMLDGSSLSMGLPCIVEAAQASAHV
eukprot:7031400-Prymnesium_polylepis.1